MTYCSSLGQICRTGSDKGGIGNYKGGLISPIFNSTKTSVFCTKAPSRFASFCSRLSWDHRRPRRTFLSVLFWKQCIVLLRQGWGPLKGAVSAQKAFQWSETETKKLLRGTEDGCHWFALRAWINTCLLVSDYTFQKHSAASPWMEKNTVTTSSKTTGGTGLMWQWMEVMDVSLGSWQWEEAEMSMRSPFPKETSAGVVTCFIDFLSQFSPFARTACVSGMDRSTWLFQIRKGRSTSNSSTSDTKCNFIKLAYNTLVITLNWCWKDTWMLRHICLQSGSSTKSYLFIIQAY